MNSFGRIFRISIFGESHGNTIGILIDGCPSGIKVEQEDLIVDINKRKAGIKGTTERIESDIPSIRSGFLNNFSTGAPILITFDNHNHNSQDYHNILEHPRPGHADMTSTTKYYGFNDLRGGGHFSGRLTLAIVAAGAIAKKIIEPIDVKAQIHSIYGIENEQDYLKKIKEISNLGNSLGGIVECKTKNVIVGLGEPFFDSIESIISHLIFSIPGVKGVEFGNGFGSTKLLGSENNDMLLDEKGSTKTNNSGGINGGISNGNELYFRVAFKPASSIKIPQATYNLTTKEINVLRIKGRHDACYVLRTPIIIEAITSIALADFVLLKNALNLSIKTKK